jgi:hypothetical protein
MPLLVVLLFLSQDYSHRGFVESRGTLYPQTAINDSSHGVGELFVRYESFYRPSQRFQFAGAVEARTDTHRQTERNFRVDFDDRSLQRPMFSVRRLSAQYRGNYRGNLTVEAGKQLVRWGKTDIVNPTDRFAPRDFLTVVDSEFLGVYALRGTWESGSETIDVLWSPFLTPSRLPLQNQRWNVPPPGAASLPVSRTIPAGTQSGIRWSHIGFVEFSAAVYSGFDHLPVFEFDPVQNVIHESYPKLKMAGGDFAVPFPWLTLKSEAAYFDYPDPSGGAFVLYVVQLERQAGEWFFVGGYSGEVVTREAGLSASFNPDRGRTRTLLGRAGYTIDTNRSVAVEGAVRHNGDGVWLKSEYSQAFGQHWRVTAGFTLIRGNPADFIGQYRRNSHGSIAVRYSF